jgi:hypothetical protein
MWVIYYNHKRPHQGIGGLCPADRYFEIQSELRKTIEQGIQDNLLEIALRGKPRLPFYMVGRMEGQSVVLRAEKGRLRLSVDAENDDITQEVVYNLNEKGHDNGEEGEGKEREEAAYDKLRGDGEVQGGSVGMDREEETDGGMPGAVDTVDDTFSMAEASNGRYATGAGAEGKPGEGAGAISASAGDAGKKASESPDGHSTGQIGKNALKGTGSKEIGDIEGSEALLQE